MQYALTKTRGVDVFHEVLFALSGTRSAFSSYPFAVKELFHLSEAVLLERILTLGQEYGKLKNFIENTKNRQFEEGEKVGLYLLGFAEHLNTALAPYWDDVVLLEQEIMSQSHNSLHFIWSKMHRHSELLSGLLSLVSSIVSQGSYGCIVLQHLHHVLSSDVGVTRAAVAIIIDGMNEIFFRQISCWLLYGDLIDTHHEFFIQENTEELAEDTPFEKYCLNCAMLPDHIEIGLARKVLMVGQTVLFLRSNPSYLNGGEEPEESEEICINRSGLFGAKESKMQEKLAGVREVCKWNENGIMEKLVSEMSSYVTTQLWTLAVQGAQLMDQLYLVNDFFLLGRGELFHEFATQVDLHLSKLPSGVLHHIDFNIILHESARKVLIKEESLQRFSLEFLKEEPEAASEEDSKGEWNRFLVKYDAPWPLQLLFTEEALKTYNIIFRFLLRLKKIEVKLGQCWLWNKSRRYEQDNLKRRQLHRNLCFLVNNLQYYFHADVLNSQFMILETAVKSSKDFERIQRAHDLFLENLTSQLFLCIYIKFMITTPLLKLLQSYSPPNTKMLEEFTFSILQFLLDRLVASSGSADSCLVETDENKSKNPIQRSINKILELCEEYCCSPDFQLESELSEEVINCMLTRFEAFVEFLLNHLTRITNQAMHPSSQHLLQFLLRLDFNSFFSNQFSSSLASIYF